MSIYAVIAEYNPFHNGHAYQLLKNKQAGDAVVAVMSGNFVQRGESAIFPKRVRARAALLSGADLVLELPCAYAASSAEGFAKGAVGIINAMGCADFLTFGSECGDIEALTAAARLLLSDSVQAAIRENLVKGVSYPSARMAAVAQNGGEALSAVLAEPNNLLAVEYIKALLQSGSSVLPMTVKRQGAGHDAVMPDGEFLSASALRSFLKEGKDISPFVPQSAMQVYKDAIERGEGPADYKKLETAVLAHLRKCTPADFAALPDVSEGIENRLLQAVRTASDLESLYALTKTKRYTHSRIRRLVLSSFLGLTASLRDMPPPYIRVLGFNAAGRSVLKTMSKTASLPIVAVVSDFKKLGADAKRMFALECRATDLFALTQPEIGVCGTEMTDFLISL